MKGYKVFTHDYRSPIQGGEPVWEGTLPFMLPEVEVDASEAECAAGWNFCIEPEDALAIAGFWPDGWPALLFQVETPEGVLAIERGRKCRAARLTILKEVDARPIICNLSDRWFGDNADAMTTEQVAWYDAFRRPEYDESKVRDELEVALETRELSWNLRCFDSAWGAWNAWKAWGARKAWTARAAWKAWTAWGAWGARTAWGARKAWTARAAWKAWTAWGARKAWNARKAWAARDAWGALTVFYASRKGWTNCTSDYLTKGIRDAYANGLAVALPVADDTLGYAMIEEDKQ